MGPCPLQVKKLLMWPTSGADVTRGPACVPLAAKRPKINWLRLANLATCLSSLSNSVLVASERARAHISDGRHRRHREIMLGRRAGSGS
jgi:hypothetical protein